MATNDPVIWVFPILIRVHSETEVSGSSKPSLLWGEWYSFNYYLYTMEQSALRTWMWCSCAPNASFADCPPVKPLHSSNLCCLDLCCDRLSPRGSEGGTVYLPMVLANFPQFCSIYSRPLINWLVCDNRQFIILSYEPPKLKLCTNTGLFPHVPCHLCSLHK